MLSVILAGASAYIYFQVKGGNFFTLTQTTTTEVTTVNRDKLTETVNFFEAKRARFEAEKNAPGTYVDPGV